jgi:class 3 adenylate cyclase
MYPNPQTVLIVDDSEENRDLLARQVKRFGYETDMAEDGEQALNKLQTQPYDLVLLDIMMPGLNGYQVLEQIKHDPALQIIPVIMISAVDDLDGVVRCMELGADDYIFKPFKVILLKARVNASLERKRLRDQEAAYLKALKAEQEKSERLLLNILPRPIAERLKQQEGSKGIIADSFPEVTVLFADIVNFTGLAASVSPTGLVTLLNEVFSTFDDLAEKYGLEKIKTIGDAYLLASGLPTPRADHAAAAAKMALAMQRVSKMFRTTKGESIRLRIGLHTGPVTAGVIGTKKFAYDLWGDAVNTASRMESHGLPDCIQVTEATYQRLRYEFKFEERGLVPVKGKGEMKTYLLIGKAIQSMHSVS